MNVQEIPLRLITLPPELHRRTLDAAALEDLAASIRDIGLLNPITLEIEGDHYVLRAGHRRLEAHRLLRRDTIAAHVRDAHALAHGEVLTWAENADRVDITPIEEAEAIARLMRNAHLTAAQVARLRRRGVAWVEQRLELLKCPPELQELVHRGEMPMTHACELARVTDPAHRDHLTRYVLMSGASLSVVKDWVAQWRLNATRDDGAAAPLPPLPQPGERIIVLIPCLTCSEPHPPHELRASHICIGCYDAIMESTADWRRHISTAPTRAPHG